MPVLSERVPILGDERLDALLDLVLRHLRVLDLVEEIGLDGALLADVLLIDRVLNGEHEGTGLRVTPQVVPVQNTTALLGALHLQRCIGLRDW